MSRAGAEAVARGHQLLASLAALGYDFFTGVPCSLLDGLYAALEAEDRPCLPATREDLALGLAAGAALAGRRPVVLMQNSGLGVAVNALLSLQKMYALPALLVVSWRGAGPDAPEHVEMGRIMIPLLDRLGIPHRGAFEAGALDPAFHRGGMPVALVVQPGELA